MFTIQTNDLPPELLIRSNSDEDINILIGENGSGKSSLLNSLARHYSKLNTSTIAIANTIYDKFIYDKNVNILRASFGKNIANRTIIEALKSLANDDLNRMRNIANTFLYIGFDPVITFRLKGVARNYREKIELSNLTEVQKSDIIYLLDRYFNRNYLNENTVSVNFDTDNFVDLKDSYLIMIFLYEKQLKSMKLVSQINIYLRKSGNDIPTLKASSGELTLVVTLIYITATITENSVILIDEPENSLHPKWQIEYVKKLIELFYYYQPKIIIATHSPLILNGAELNTRKIKIFKGQNGIFNLHENITKNVEEIYQDFFDITTPENRFVSDSIVEKMNLLSSKQISEHDFESYIQKLKDNSYDIAQIEALDDLAELGKKVSNETSDNNATGL